MQTHGLNVLLKAENKSTPVRNTAAKSAPKAKSAAKTGQAAKKAPAKKKK